MLRIRVGDADLRVLERGDGPPLLLVHGFPLDHSMWQAQIDDWATSFHVIAPDLRGFGQSSVTAGTVTMEQFADDLAGLLDALAIREPVHFCGLSMGGYIAWQFWQRHAARLRSLIVCDTRAMNDSEETARGRLLAADQVIANGPTQLVESMLPRLFSSAALTAMPARIEATRQIMLSTPREGIAAALRGMAARPDMTAELRRMTVPTLVVCGEHDVISRTTEMRAIAGAITNAKYVEVADAGHMAPLEKPAEVNAAVRKFLLG